MPVAWPVNAQWSGDGVPVDDAARPVGAGVVRFDPSTNRLTALRAGSATLTLVVGGVKETATIQVTGVGAHRS